MRTLAILTISALTTLAACNGRTLVDTEWFLVSVQGEEPLAGTDITLRLEESTFSGFDGCNRYGGEYKASDGHSFLVIEVWRSLMLCPSPKGIMARGATYRDVLSKAATYELTGSQLILKDREGKTLLVFVKAKDSKEGTSGWSEQQASRDGIDARILAGSKELLRRASHIRPPASSDVSWFKHGESSLKFNLMLISATYHTW
jgi:heat shock protein HslJ